MRPSTTLTTLAVMSLASIAHAQALHNTDFVLALEDNTIVTGAVDPDSGNPVFPRRVMTAILGAEGFPNFTNNPGYNAVLGSLTPGMTIGFSILSAPREWDPIAMNFDTIATDTITVRAAAQNINAPTTDTRVEGITFGQASTSASASFHHHMQYLVNNAQGPAVETILLLELELWSGNTSANPSDPIYILFAQGSAVADLEFAVDYVESTLAAPTCPADFTGDNQLDFFDLSAFLTALGNEDPSADLSPDDQYDFFDVSAYLTLYQQGCP
jgi:hypothetical protein